jgi:hypothetical protein
LFLEILKLFGKKYFEINLKKMNRLKCFFGNFLEKNVFFREKSFC